jgi:hypothetical protein
MVLSMATAHNCGARRRRKMEHWIDLHPHIADKVLIRPFSSKPSATLRPSYY